MNYFVRRCLAAAFSCISASSLLIFSVESAYALGVQANTQIAQFSAAPVPASYLFVATAVVGVGALVRKIGGSDE